MDRSTQLYGFVCVCVCLKVQHQKVLWMFEPIPNYVQGGGKSFFGQMGELTVWVSVRPLNPPALK